MATKKMPPWMGKETPAEEKKEAKGGKPNPFAKGKAKPFASGGMVRRGYGKARGC